MEKKGAAKGLIIKTWKRCKSFGGVGGGQPPSEANITGRSPKTKSWPRRKSSVPEGCFSVYVGPEKERYVIRTECLNHPLFKSLLDQAELEYGYAVDGPLLLPCGVDQFERVLLKMEDDEEYGSAAGMRRSSCNLGDVGYNAYQLLSPARPAMFYRNFKV